MLTLILLIILGSSLVYLSQYNFELVTVNMGFQMFENVPLFYVIVGSLLTGLVFAYLVHLVYYISNSLALKAKKNEIKKNREEILELTKRVHQLELEKEKLKQTSDSEPQDKLAL